MKSSDFIVPIDEGASIRFHRTKQNGPFSRHISMGLVLDLGDEQLEIQLDADDVARLKLWLAEHYTDPMN